MNMQGGMGQMGMGGGGMGPGPMPGPMGLPGPGMQVPMGACLPGSGMIQGMPTNSPMGVPPGMMHPNPGTPGQIQGPMPQQQQPQEKLDNISKVKSLMPNLRESLMQTLKTAAQTLHQNHLIDAGNIKGVDGVVPRFDKNLEEFYSLCDQIELHLKTSQECLMQGSSSSRYMPFNVTPTRTEPVPGQDSNSLTYPQYLATTKSQIAYVKEIHDSLLQTAQNVAATD